MAGVLFAFLAGLAAALAGFGHRWGWWHYRTGFAVLKAAAYFGIAAAVVSLAGLIVTRPFLLRQAAVLSLVGILIGLLTASIPWSWMRTAKHMPVTFLHTQVRSMVGSLVMVGEGKWNADDLSRVLAARDRTACGQVAPPDGLYLMMRVDYEAEIAVDNRPINRGQRAQVGDRHALVDLVHGLPDQAEFHHRAIGGDEARVGGAAGGGQFRLAAGDFRDRIGHQLGERARLADEHAGVRRLPLERES